MKYIKIVQNYFKFCPLILNHIIFVLTKETFKQSDVKTLHEKGKVRDVSLCEVTANLN